MLSPADLQRFTEDGRDTERFAVMTPEERLALFLQLCELTDAITRGRPDADALRAPTPRSPESEALWLRLIARARDERRGR
ncbi:MAG: hypothetical protein M3Y87_13855 [Myxococcota bacterium]|nr:hypothetical protein [Myxococcota bacterium]